MKVQRKKNGSTVRAAVSLQQMKQKGQNYYYIISYTAPGNTLKKQPKLLLKPCIAALLSNPLILVPFGWVYLKHCECIFSLPPGGVWPNSFCCHPSNTEVNWHFISAAQNIKIFHVENWRAICVYRNNATVGLDNHQKSMLMVFIGTTSLIESGSSDLCTWKL